MQKIWRYTTLLYLLGLQTQENAGKYKTRDNRKRSNCLSPSLEVGGRWAAELIFNGQ